MSEIKITVTDDIDVLNDFFEANDLEISDAEPVETNVIKAWRADDENDKLVGGVCLAFREGDYIIDGIAVDQSLRGKRMGEKLLGLAIDQVKSLGGKKLFLVARAPGFFKTQGFNIVSEKEAPLFFECADCPQYKVDCFPEIMLLEV